MAEGTPNFLVWEDDNGDLHAVDVDMVKSHEDDRTATVTSHPVEKGSPIGDHVIHDPDKLTVEIAQTQSPFPSPALPDAVWSKPAGFSNQTTTLDVRPSLFQPGGLLAVSQAVGGVLASILGTAVESLPVKVTTWQAETPVDRVGALHDQLVAIKTGARFCTVTFKGRVYPQFICTRVNWKTQPGEVGLGRFSLEFQSVRLVTNATTELPDPASLRLIPKEEQTNPPKRSSANVSGAVNNNKFGSLAHMITGAGR